MLQVNTDAVVTVRPERTAFAADIPIRAEHEVMDDELGSPGKQISQSLLARWAVENVRLLDEFPWQSTPLAAQFVPQAREFFLLCKERFARSDPLVVRDYGMIFAFAVLSHVALFHR